MLEAWNEKLLAHACRVELLKRIHKSCLGKGSKFGGHKKGLRALEES